MQDVFDALCSLVIGGVIIILLLGFNVNIVKGSASQVHKLTAQSNLTSLTDVMESDFRKMGYRTTLGSSQDSCILYADSLRIVFTGDLDNDGAVDVLEYRLEQSHPDWNTNPRTRTLSRIVNGNRQAIDLGVTTFRFKYADRFGYPLASNPVSLPSKIRSVRVTMTLESAVPYDSLYSGVYWDRLLIPKNLR